MGERRQKERDGGGGITELTIITIIMLTTRCAMLLMGLQESV